MEIKLTKRQEIMFKRYASTQKECMPNCMGTVFPCIYLVQDTRESQVVDISYGNGDFQTFTLYRLEDPKDRDYGSEYLKTFYDIDVLCDYLKENHDIEADLALCEDVDDINEAVEEDVFKVEVTERDYVYETIAYFLVYDEAKLYLVYQGHNLSDRARIACRSVGKDNRGDIREICKIILGIGEELLKKENEEK